MFYKLIIEDDDGKKTIVPLVRDEIPIGRKDGSIIRLTEKNVSRDHALLFRRNEMFFVQDRGSYTGTLHNGIRIKPAEEVPLEDGDFLKIGGYSLKIKATTDRGSSDRNDGRDVGSASPPKWVEPPPGLISTKGGIAIENTRQGANRSSASRQQTQQIKTQSVDGEQVYGPNRVVCVSRNFAGLEFTLRQGETVVGRTAENDIVLEHRSISRHHAKFVTSADGVRIIDLDSANGVEVNSERVKSENLDAGDLVDLGAIKFRYVSPEEDFLFSRDARIYDQIPLRKGMFSRANVLVAAALAVIISVFAIAHNVNKKRRKMAHSKLVHSKTNEVQSVVQPKNKAATKLQLKVALLEKRWGSAVELCNSLSAKEVQEVQSSCNQARSENTSEKLFRKGFSVLREGDAASALALFHRVPRSSTYYDLIRNADEYLVEIKKHESKILNEVKLLVSKGECEKANQVLEKSRAQLEDISKISAVAVRCQPVASTVITGQKPTAVPESSADSNSNSKDLSAGKYTVKESERREAKGKELIARANESFRDGSYRKALNSAKLATKYLPKNQQALYVAGASACFLRKRVSARSFFAKLSTVRQQQMIEFCERAGISVP